MRKAISHQPSAISRRVRLRRNFIRRGFNLVELLIALGITATLMTATMVALNASFMAYQSTTEVASTHTIGRLAMHRMLTMIRTGTDFAPFPVNPNDKIVYSNDIQFRAASGQIMSIEWNEEFEELEVVVFDADGETELSRNVLLEGVIATLDEDGDPVPPFTLEFAKGRILYRATIDLTIVPDDNMSVTLDGQSADRIRLVATSMPRSIAY